MRKNKQKNSKNISAIVNNLLIFQKYCDKINKSKGYGGYHMLNSLNNVVNFLNSYIWGVGMLILIVGSGLYFTIRLHGFQFVHFKDMWSRIVLDDSCRYDQLGSMFCRVYVVSSL